MALDEYMSSSLTPELNQAKDEIRRYAEDYGLDFFEVIFEMIDHEQMNSLAALGGFPVRYPHWRFGMDYDQLSKGYTWGLQKIYEMVINTNPVYAYLMKSNNLVDQKTVIAHVYGHADFFKHNEWYSKTNRKMLDVMANHAVKIRDYMDQYGQDRVEGFIDHCLSLENLIDSHLPFIQKKSVLTPSPLDEEVVPEEAPSGKIRSDRSYMDSYMNPPEFIDEQKRKLNDQQRKAKRNPAEPEKDILNFLIKNAPLERWEQEVLSIIREEAYYFAPQGQTKIMNEGWASYWHSKIMTQKALKDSEVIDFADHHAGTLVMHPGRLNPYKVGIELFRDIEDRWDRGKFGKEYEECDNMSVKATWDQKLNLGRKKIFEVRRVCNDVTFIDQYLTEEFVERLKLYTYGLNRRTNQYEITDRNFKKIKEKLLFQITNLGQPFIYVVDGNDHGKGELLLWHKHQGIDLDGKWCKETLRSLHHMWKRPVHLETEVDGQKKRITFHAGEFIEKFL